jgi:hypothetical protein
MKLCKYTFNEIWKDNAVISCITVIQKWVNFRQL